MPIFVNRRAPIGLPEFAALYSSEGATPEEAASNIHLNYPMEAKTVLADRWRNLGIPMSPEKYFSGFARVAKDTPGAPAMPAGASNPRPPQLGPMVYPMDRRPTFSSEAERNIAIASGAWDPNYESPLQKANVEALMKIDADKRAAIRARADIEAPIALDTPKDLLQSQLAGDTLGLTKKFLIRRAGFTPEQYMRQAAGGTPDSMLAAVIGTATPTLKPYQPEAGFGALEGSALPSRLDFTVYNDPDFQRALRENPEEAKYAYSRLTGRKLETDIAETLATRKNQVDVGRKFATDALTQGAQRDPVSGKWRIWNMAETEAQLGLGQTRPTRQLVDATPEQAKWLDTHYSSIMGQPLPRQSVEDTQHSKSIMQTMQGVPEFTQAVAAHEKLINRKLTTEELNRKAMQMLKQLSAPNPITEGIRDLGGVLQPLQSALPF